MTSYEQLRRKLAREQKTWLVTGVAGFIGSNLLETLLSLNQRVVGLDNFTTGHRHNLDQAVDDAYRSPMWEGRPRSELQANFHFIEGDIRDLETCRRAMSFPVPPFEMAPNASSVESVTSVAMSNLPLCKRGNEGDLTPVARAHVVEIPPAPLSKRGEHPKHRPTSLSTTNANSAFEQGESGDISAADRSSDAPTGIAVDYVLHQAALGSVPRSIEDPITTNQANIDGFLNMLVAARDAHVERFVYAASSSTYGDHPGLPKVEDKIGNPLSPYAVTKLVNELYADVFARAYGFNTIGLRYFNIFGKRQDPNGAYAAVIPKWIAAMINNEPVYINGDGETSRDFCYIDNAVQANLLAATVGPPPPVGEGLGVREPAQNEAPDPTNQVYNVAVGDRTSLNDLCEHLRANLAERLPHLGNFKPTHRDFRAGDVRHSLADIGKARRLLGYHPSHHIGQGLQEAMAWYVANLGG